MSALTDRLEKLAHEAIRDYSAQLAAGGEPPCPTWADDVIEVCLQHSSMTGTLNIMQQLIDATDAIVMFKQQAQ